MQLTDAQKELLNKMLQMPKGTVMKKGKTERILWGVGPGYIFYKIKSRPRQTTMLHVVQFMKWAEKAEFVEQ